MEISTRISNKLRCMSLLCSFLVLFIHIGVSSHNTGPWIIRAFFSHGIGKIAVPFFFTAAGYLLAGHMNEQGWYKRELVKRIQTLIIPLLIWCVLWFAYGICSIVVCNLLKGRALGTNITCPTLIGISKIAAVYPFSQPYLGVLWFVRTLFVLVTFSPFLKKIASPVGVAILLVANGLIHPDYGVKCTPLIFTFQEGFLSFFGAAFFTAGIMLRKKNLSIDVSWKIGLPMLGIGLLLLIIRGFPYEDIVARRLTWAYIPFLLVGIWWMCPAAKLPSLLSSAAFPVYAFHMFAISIISFICKITGIAWLCGYGCTGIGYVCFGVIAFMICISFAWFMRQVSPRLSRIIFGGR